MSLTITRPGLPVPLPLTRGGTEATTAAEARTKLELGDLALLTAPGGTATFLRADKTWAVPPGGGGGGGDVSSSTGLSVDSELALFDGTTGKLLKRGTGTGLARLTSGVLGTVAAPTGAVVGTTDTQTLTGKTLSGASNTLTIREADLLLTDLTTANVSTTQHGLTPKAPGDTALFLRGDGTWAAPAGGGSYTDEQAQDAIGAMLVDSATIDLTYTDATPALTASVIDASITEAKLGFSDVTTKDASTTAHGLLRKLSGTATEYLNGAGAWTTPAGGGTNYWSRVASSNTLLSAFSAFWSLEEASGNRVDRIGSLALTPVGGANLTQVAGKIGQAVGMNGTAGTYLTMASSAAVTMNTTTSLTVMAWVYLTALSGCAYVSKGNAGASATYEYLLSMHVSANKFQFGIANGSAVHILQDTGPVPTLGAWHLVIGWFDVAANTINLQVDNGTVVSATATTTSYASAHPCELGRHAAWGASPSLNGRIDMPGIAKRVLTATERTGLWNAGAGIDYPFGSTAVSYLTPLTSDDSLLLGVARLTNERLEVDGAVKLGSSAGTTDGTLRWSGTDFEGRKAGAWVSMTAGAGGQPLDATLTALAGLATGADQLPYATGTDTFAQTTLTPFARTLLDDTTQAAMRTTLGLTPGTDVQAQDAELQAIAGLTSAADRLPYFTGLGTAALATFTAAGRNLVDDADTAAQRTTLGLGTMATQNADAVAITGGSVSGLSAFHVVGTSQLTGITGIGAVPASGYTLVVAPGKSIWQSGSLVGINVDPTFPLDVVGNARSDAFLVNDRGQNAPAFSTDINTGGNKYAFRGLGTAPSSFGGTVQVVGQVGVQRAPQASIGLYVDFAKATQYGVAIHPTDADGGTVHIGFMNVASALVGSISCTSSATAFNTSSDVRLKHAITPLTAALERVRALRPISHLWNADDSPGEGFLAHELMVPCPLAVSGLPDEVNPDGSIKPQQVDHSKLIPLLTAGLQAALAQIDALTARLTTLEDALGA